MLGWQTKPRHGSGQSSKIIHVPIDVARSTVCTDLLPRRPNYNDGADDNDDCDGRDLVDDNDNQCSDNGVEGNFIDNDNDDESR